MVVNDGQLWLLIPWLWRLEWRLYYDDCCSAWSCFSSLVHVKRSDSAKFRSQRSSIESLADRERPLLTTIYCLVLGGSLLTTFLFNSSSWIYQVSLKLSKIWIDLTPFGSLTWHPGGWIYWLQLSFSIHNVTWDHTYHDLILHYDMMLVISWVYNMI